MSSDRSLSELEYRLLIDSYLKAATKISEQIDVLKHQAMGVIHVCNSVKAQGSASALLNGNEKYLDSFAYNALRVGSEIYTETALLPEVNSHVHSTFLQTKDPQNLIKVKGSAETIQIKIPMIPRFIKPQNRVNSLPATWISPVSFAPLIQEKLILFLQKNQIDLAAWGEKTINILYVYPASTCLIIDTDSHDTKSIIDAVTKPLPGGDSALCCSIYQETVKASSENACTYILLKQGLRNIISKENIESFDLEIL